MAKVIKLTDNSAVTLLPITDSAYVQHRWKEGATGGTTVTSVQDALNNVIDRVDGVHASGSDNQHLSASAAENVATISLDGNGGSVKISNNGAQSAGSKDAYVAITYSTEKGIQLKVSYTDTNTDHYDKLTRSYSDGLKIFSVGTGGTATGSNTGDYYVPIATASRLGVVKSVTTGTTSGRDYDVEVKADGTMKVNVPWTDTTTSYSGHYTPTQGTAVQQTGSVNIGGTFTEISYTFDGKGHKNAQVTKTWTINAPSTQTVIKSATFSNNMKYAELKTNADDINETWLKTVTGLANSINSNSYVAVSSHSTSTCTAYVKTT